MRAVRIRACGANRGQLEPRSMVEPPLTCVQAEVKGMMDTTGIGGTTRRGPLTPLPHDYMFATIFTSKHVSG